LGQLVLPPSLMILDGTPPAAVTAAALQLAHRYMPLLAQLDLTTIEATTAPPVLLAPLLPHAEPTLDAALQRASQAAARASEAEEAGFRSAMEAALSTARITAAMMGTMPGAAQLHASNFGVELGDEREVARAVEHSVMVAALDMGMERCAAWRVQKAAGASERLGAQGGLAALACAALEAACAAGSAAGSGRAEAARHGCALSGAGPVASHCMVVALPGLSTGPCRSAD
jgi:hypothetical protein